ncbi:MAG: AmmeMemoRadiSam system protein B [Candidatus Woesearchaeota archaeon]
MRIRETAVAGAFYPAEKERLRDLITGLAKQAEGSPEKDINGIIVPHAGYIFSGKTACYGFKRIDDRFNKVVVLGPNHTVYTNRAIIDDNDAWRSPFGEVKISHDGIPEDLVRDSTPHIKEHSIEVQIPFLQHFISDFSLIPVIVGDLDEDMVTRYTEVINNLLDDRTLLVISTDLSHFHTKEKAEMIDKHTIENIIRGKGTLDACGKNPLRIAIELCKKNNWKIELLDYSTSADFTGDESAVVGYASFRF